jgi:hypothetical protein
MQEFSLMAISNVGVVPGLAFATRTIYLKNSPAAWSSSTGFFVGFRNAPT